MLRNKHRKTNIATLLPFRIRNNFRRLPNMFPQPQDILQDNSDTMLQDFEDDVNGEEHSNNGDDHDYLEQRSDDGYLEQNDDNDDLDDDDDDDDHDYLEQRSDDGYLEQSDDDDDFDDDDDDHLGQRSNLGRHENETESDDVMSLESDEDYATTSSDNEERYDADTSSEEKLLVDAALAEDKLPSSDGDFAPYFQDLTTAALFCWIHKHNISTSAYEDLVDIIMRPEFNRDHIVKNIRRFRTWRKHLPLPSISAKPISISSKKTPSTSKDSKMAYQISISDIIWNVLNNPSLVKTMYFGPGVDSEIKSEYWHGTLWAESPLFGKEQLMISEGNYILLF
jgi:hypothetical protein